MPKPTHSELPSGQTLWRCRGYAILRPDRRLAVDDRGRPHFLFQLHEAGKLRDELSRQLGKCKVTLVTLEVSESAKR